MKLLKSNFSLICILLGLTITPLHASNTTDTVLEKEATELNLYQKDQADVGIQNPDLSLVMKKALTLADLLFNSTGELKTSLCQSLKSSFIGSNPSDYEKNMENVLDQLTSNWQPFFDSVKKPEDEKGVSNIVLRALFTLPPNEPVTDRHAKVAVLSALLAPVNQGPVGDCFAVADLIRDHNEYFQHSANDYKEIVEKGYLTRVVNGNNDNFFFLPSIADTDATNPITIDRSGKLANSKTSLANANGIKAAFTLMGATPQTFQDALAIIFQPLNTETVQTTPAEFIKACAEALALRNPNLNKDELNLIGLYGFSSLTNNPVLRAAESAFAAMAEDRPQDSTRGNINECVEQATQNFWKSLGSIANNYHQAFSKNFNDSYRLIYNLNIPLSHVSADGSSSDGGFQLYERIPGQPNSIGTRISTPGEFLNLILKAIITTSKQLAADPATLSIGEKLTDNVKKDQFLRNVLWDYDNSNKDESNPVANYQKLTRTPMQSCDGDNPYEVDDVDTSHVFEKNIQYYRPTNPQALVVWCLNLSKNAMHGLLPMNSPQHAFNFVPGISDIQAFQKSGLTADNWVNQTVIIPGMKISTRKIDTLTAKNFNDGVFSYLSNSLSKAAYTKLTTHLIGQSLTIQQYAESLLKGIITLLDLDQAQTDEAALIIDYSLLQSLPINDQSIIHNTAIRFAFTNWNMGSKDIYFCGYYNVRTEKISFGNIEEDRTQLQPMDEMEWVNNMEWDVDLNPYAPVLQLTGT